MKDLLYYHLSAALIESSEFEKKRVTKKATLL